MNLSSQVKSEVWRRRETRRSGDRWKEEREVGSCGPLLGFASTQTWVVHSTKAQLLHSWWLLGPTPTSYNIFQPPLWTFKIIQFFEKKGDQMYANFEGSIGPKMTTFSTAHSETQNLKADMLRSIYLVYLRFWRDRLLIFLLVFPAQKVSKKQGVSKIVNFGPNCWVPDRTPPCFPVKIHTCSKPRFDTVPMHSPWPLLLRK
jgi:hypothetical protein